MNSQFATVWVLKFSRELSHAKLKSEEGCIDNIGWLVFKCATLTYNVHLQRNQDKVMK